MLLLCYPKCTTCQKAIAWLKENHIEVEMRDIKSQNPTEEELTRWHAASGLPLKRFFNTSGLVYKEMGLKDKLASMDEAQQLALLATDGMLVKRPLLIGDGFVLVGFRLLEWEKKLLSAPERTFVTSKGFLGVVRNGVTYIDNCLIENKTYSLPPEYGNGLTAETQAAFDKMAAAAKKDGLDIYISSGFRSYSYQEGLYNRYVERDGVEKADTYSARAGHSEHQSGLSFDVNIISDAFAGTPEAEWLDANSYKFGFILRYPKGKSDETGYKYEPWHFRYVGTKLAKILHNGGDWLTIEGYFGITSRYED